MDAWDSSSFGNDSANDWLEELLETDDSGLISEAFSAVLAAGDEMIEMQAGEEAIAAAEVVASLRGRPGKNEEVNDKVDAWIDEYELEASSALVAKARKAIDRVFNQPSELLEAWQESDDFDDWRAALTDLKDRLSA